MSRIEAAPSPTAGVAPLEITEKNEAIMTDIEIQKAPAVPVELSGGAGKMEAISAVFGNRGKLIIIGVYVLYPIQCTIWCICSFTCMLTSPG